MVGMDTAYPLQRRTSDLLEAARAVREAAELPNGYTEAPESLGALEEALRMLSAAWYQLAGDASPGIAARRLERGPRAPSWPRVDGLSREQEVHLMATLHDVAAAFSRSARVCREARSTVTPLIARRVAAGRAEVRSGDNGLPSFERRDPTRQVA